MPRTSTAVRENYRCPWCREELAQDPTGRGFVRHKTRATVATVRAIRASMTDRQRDYIKGTGRCPFELGQRDP